MNAPRSARSRRGKPHQARRGCVRVLGGAPCGYRYAPKSAGGGTARYDIVLDEARAVRLLFTWVGQERLTVPQVCRRLQRPGIRTRTGTARWHPSTAAGTLRNPAYQGSAAFGKARQIPRRPRLRPLRGQPEVARRPSAVTRHGADPIAIAVPAVVSAELFAAAAAPLADNRRCQRPGAGPARHLRQGLVACAHGGYALGGCRRTYGPKQGPARRYAYYRCRAATPGVVAREGAPRCGARQLPAAVLEAAAWHAVCQLLRAPGKIEEE